MCGGEGSGGEEGRDDEVTTVIRGFFTGNIIPQRLVSTFLHICPYTDLYLLINKCLIKKYMRVYEGLLYTAGGLHVTQ